MYVDNPKAPSATKVRLSLDVSADVNAALEKMADQLATSKSEILRKAIALMQVASEAKSRHQKLGVMDADRNVLTEIVGV
ncbi:MAG TPA: ribbon-helix-helix protein, CopG family [Rhizomicrobium sp.]|nr:ribbon-helix-helix protein, CopG family [Rhizomicrobium sp.]